ncbi:hypothetical protein GCM10028817_41500 [Spirosoma pomorum]
MSRDLALLDATVDWPALNTLIMLRSHRWQGEQLSTATRFYISSLRTATAQQLATYIRHHWRIENQLHWQLDIVFRVCWGISFGNTRRYAVA